MGAAYSPPLVGVSELVIGSERGLEIWSVDGKLKRLVSAGPALHPRWLDAASVVVLVPAKPDTLSLGAELQRVALADGKRTPLATLPKFTCAAPAAASGDTPWDPRLEDESDFELDPALDLVCLRLQRQASGSQLSVRVNLGTRQVDRWLSLAEEECTPPSDVELLEPEHQIGYRDGEPWCTYRSAGEELATETADSRPFDADDDGNVQQHRAAGWQTILHIDGYTTERRSPSGRWLLLHGDVIEGDFVTRSLILLDREQGLVYPIPAETAPWPKPLQTGDRAHHELPTPIEHTAQVVGESEVRWLSTPDSELLILDSLAVRPGVGTFDFQGQLAR